MDRILSSKRDDFPLCRGIAVNVSFLGSEGN
jgi:hypothetical protein